MGIKSCVTSVTSTITRNTIRKVHLPARRRALHQRPQLTRGVSRKLRTRKFTTRRNAGLRDIAALLREVTCLPQRPIKFSLPLS